MSEALLETTEAKSTARRIVAPPASGIYFDVPMSEYLSWDACSASRLADLRRTAAYCRHRTLTQKAPTPSLILGSAIHCRVLEPEQYSKRFCVRPEGHGNSNAFKEAKAKLLAAGYEVLAQKDFDSVEAIAANIAAHPAASRILSASPEREVSIVWEMTLDDGSTLTCKIRPDALADAARLCTDLKSTLNWKMQAERDAFERSLYGWGYHLSAPFYLDGLATVGRDYENFAFLVVEKSEPNEVAVYDLDAEALEAGRLDYRRLAHVYARCMRSNVWPGHSDRVERIGLPRYAYSLIYEGE